MTDEMRQFFYLRVLLWEKTAFNLCWWVDFVQAFWCSSEETLYPSKVLGNNLCSCLLAVQVFPTIWHLPLLYDSSERLIKSREK